jgi:hypothetical protein
MLSLFSVFITRDSALIKLHKHITKQAPHNAETFRLQFSRKNNDRTYIVSSNLLVFPILSGIETTQGT